MRNATSKFRGCIFDAHTVLRFLNLCKKRFTHLGRKLFGIIELWQEKIMRQDHGRDGYGTSERAAARFVHARHACMPAFPCRMLVSVECKHALLFHLCTIMATHEPCNGFARVRTALSQKSRIHCIQ